MTDSLVAAPAAAADDAVEVVVAAQFRGPPNSGNGGYVCGLLARHFLARVGPGPVKVVLRAPIPVDTPLRVVGAGESVRLTGLAGDLIAEAAPGDGADLPQPPVPPSLDEAIAAGGRFVGLSRPFHPICFTCATVLDEGFGLRIFTGQVAGRDAGVVAGPWTPHAHFADPDGQAGLEAIWGALDCPGSVAWVTQGAGAGLLGTMTFETLRRPRTGEACIVLAWPVEASGRKSISGTALFSAAGELMARSRQVWIGRPMTATAP